MHSCSLCLCGLDVTGGRLGFCLRLEWFCRGASSDFCHWGSRFRFQPHDKRYGEISEYIEWLDREGMTVRARGKCVLAGG
jgi:hypothetical protein